MQPRIGRFPGRHVRLRIGVGLPTGAPRPERRPDPFAGSMGLSRHGSEFQRAGAF